jgi:hypothetical protein
MVMGARVIVSYMKSWRERLQKKKHNKPDSIDSIQVKIPLEFKQVAETRSERYLSQNDVEDVCIDFEKKYVKMDQFASD